MSGAKALAGARVWGSHYGWEGGCQAIRGVDVSVRRDDAVESGAVFKGGDSLLVVVVEAGGELLLSFEGLLQVVEAQ